MEGSRPIETKTPQVRELQEITQTTDTRDYLAHATRQARSYDDYDLLVDVDAHVSEGGFWSEILDLLDSDVLKQAAFGMMQGRGGGGGALLNFPPGISFQALSGRIPHQAGPREETQDPAVAGHRYVQLMRRSMDAMGVDYQVIFPTGLLNLGVHPMEDVEVYLARAFNKWMAEHILPLEKRMIGLVYLPMNSVEECEREVERYRGNSSIKGVIVTALRHAPVHHNRYMRLYRMIEEVGWPMFFHGGALWQDPSFAQLNRFISMHALSFVHYNLIHLTNWIVNALPERFPRLRVCFVESGLAWVPFIMQRLDNEVMMRQSEAPGLKRLPSDYIRDMYFSSQPLERTDMKLVKATFEAIDAEHRLLYASDWPHWDFDPPSAITTLPFLSDQAKRNILGLNAARLFDLPIKRLRPSPDEVLAARPHAS